MKFKRREFFACILAVIAGCLWFILDFMERGFEPSIFGGPILIIGSIFIPSYLSIRKNKKKS